MECLVCQEVQNLIHTALKVPPHQCKRVRVRRNGALTGKVIQIEGAVTHAQLVQIVCKKFENGTKKVQERDYHTAPQTRLFLQEGDELEKADAALQLKDDDVIYVDFFGGDFVTPTISKSAPSLKYVNSDRSINMVHNVSAIQEPDLAQYSTVPKKTFAAFVSHSKAEAAMEARFVQSWLQNKLDRRVFIDSDDLHCLSKLKDHVRDSDVIIMIQSQGLLTRPYCLIELLTAIEYGVPIIGICLSGVGTQAPYDFAEAHYYLTHLDTTLEDDHRSVAMLAEHGYDDMIKVSHLLSNVIPNRISIPMCPGGSVDQLSLTLGRVHKMMQTVEPVNVDRLPKLETWLCGRNVKAWSNWRDTLSDHLIIASCLPTIFGAYIGPYALDADFIEAVMLTVNSVNMCPFCTGLHGDLGRVAGLSAPLKLNAAKSGSECTALCKPGHKAGVNYARIFAMTDGRGKKNSAAFEAVVREYGKGRASSIVSLCWFLYWGSYTGNTLTVAIGHKPAKPDSSSSFYLQIMLYYGLLFYGVINIVSALLKALPQMPGLFSAIFGGILTIVGGTFIAPVGIIAAMMGAQHPSIEASSVKNFQITFKAIFCGIVSCLAYFLWCS